MSWGPRARANYRGLKIARRAMMRESRKRQGISRPAALSGPSSPRSTNSRVSHPSPVRPVVAVTQPARTYTEADRQTASLWMYVFFWGMLALFLACFASMVAAAFGKAAWIDVLKPGAWSMLFTVIFFFRWVKLSRVDKRLQEQTDTRAFALRAQESALEMQGTERASAGISIAPSEVRPESDPNLQRAEKALRSIRQVRSDEAALENKTPSKANVAFRPSPWKSKAQRDEEWLDQELRWRLDAKHQKDANEEARLREERHSGRL